MARIYVSSSWKNNLQQSLVEELRKRGHQVYDFRHSLADGKDECNVWTDVCQRLGLTRHRLSGTVLPGDFERMVSDDEAVERFNRHFSAMREADTCILLLPCGRSSHAEAGFMKGEGKQVFVMDTGSVTVPELMYRMFDGYFHDLECLYNAIDKVPNGR